MLEAKYEAKLEFLGGSGVAKQKIPWGSMDIFCNYTMFTVSHFLTTATFNVFRNKMYNLFI